MKPPNRWAACLGLVFLLAVVSPARAAEQAPSPPVEPGPRMLHAYLLAECQMHFDARRQAIAALKTPADVRRRQKKLRERFVEALGGFPPRAPLNGWTVGTLKGDGFRIERVIYESRPDHHVTALFYLPEGQAPFPGVLMPCGHSANGKAAEAYQRACILMAKNGLAVLCYDPIGQGERIQLLDRQGKPAIAGSTSEHTMAGVGALLVGGSTATYRIWDGLRSLDYLASRPEVDPKRLGCTGNSGGGTLTAYLMALDDRIVAAAPSCYITSLERLFATIGPQDAEQNITGQVAFGMEHADYLTMRAPRPTLVCVGTQDFFDIQGAWTSFREAKLLYGLLGHGERIDLFEYNDKHGFSKPRREAAMRWMRRWLLHQDDAPSEGDFPIFKDAQVQVTRTGQVLEDFKGKSVFDLNAQRERELAPKRAKFLAASGVEGLRKEVRRLIALPAEVPAARPLSVSGRDTVFETEPGIVVPGLLLRSTTEESKKKPIILYLHGEGKNVAARWDGPIPRLRDAGYTVLCLDLRGMGTTAPGKLASKRPNYFGVDSREAFLSLHLNRPLLGQRVRDVLAVINYLARAEEFPGIHLVAVGLAAPVGLHAAALDDRIKRLTLEQSVVSWSAVVRTPISHNQLTNVVPGVLAFYDLPDLAASLAPRPLTLASTRDPAGKPIAREEVEKAWASCRKTYKTRGAERVFVVEE
ncbi:MAG: alpha/beta fold hydrolase [Planctomycetes bacterium]|nr:alpha/beta fold hydrolase [Planctomycetota bacterium]